MYTAGAEVREVFKTLPDSGTAKEYSKAVDALNKHVAKINSTYQRHLFRKARQGEETIAQYATRLKQLSEGAIMQQKETTKFVTR